MKKTAKKLISPVLMTIFCLGITFVGYAQETAAVEIENPWRREISIGYNQSTGNTEKAELMLSGEIKKVMAEAEFLGKAEIYYSSSDKKMDSQKWSSLVRYFYNFGDEKMWFNSYQVLVDHDRFADVDYRILPSVGLGYWFSKEDDWKAMLEGSFGFEVTNYRSSQPDDEEAVFIGHTYLEKKILDNARITEDASIIPSLEGNGARFKSETAFTNPLSEALDLSIKFIVDYDTDPPPDIKKTDTRLITGLKYSF